MSEHNAENDAPAYGFGLLRPASGDVDLTPITGGLDPDIDCVLPPVECDNYEPPLTCLTAPSSESARCDRCKARVTPPAPPLDSSPDPQDGDR